jgi:hypothetical protein
MAVIENEYLAAINGEQKGPLNGDDYTVIGITRTTGAHREIILAEPENANAFYVEDLESKEKYPLPCGSLMKGPPQTKLQSRNAPQLVQLN